MKSSRPIVAATLFLFSLLLSIPCVADAAEEPPMLKDVLTRLDTLADRIEKLDQRILRLERMLLKRPIRVDAHGIIRDEKGRPVGIWGIDAAPSGGTGVPKR